MLAKFIVGAFMIYTVIVLAGIGAFEGNKKFRTFVYGGGYLLLTGLVLAYHSVIM